MEVQEIPDGFEAGYRCLACYHSTVIEGLLSCPSCGTPNALVVAHLRKNRVREQAPAFIGPRGGIHTLGGGGLSDEDEDGYMPSVSSGDLASALSSRGRDDEEDEDDEDDEDDENDGALVDEDEATALDEISDDEDSEYLQTGVDAFDRILSAHGGVPFPAAIILGGDPGAGKSRLLAKALASFIEENDVKVMYGCGEEPAARLRGRFKELNLLTKRVGRRLIIKGGSSIDALLEAFEENECDLLAIDSINVYTKKGVNGIAGSPNQAKAVTRFFCKTMHKLGTTAIGISHVSKDKKMAGPMTVQHDVDAVFMLEIMNDGKVRLSASTNKNRFGPTLASGCASYFRMTEKGLVEAKSPEDEEAEKKERKAQKAAVKKGKKVSK